MSYRGAEVIRNLIPDGQKRVYGKGRPWRDKRDVLGGILRYAASVKFTLYQLAGGHPVSYSSGWRCLRKT